MEVDRAILVRRVAPTHFRTVPVRPRHCAGGKINQHTGQLVRT